MENYGQQLEGRREYKRCGLDFRTPICGYDALERAIRQDSVEMILEIFRLWPQSEHGVQHCPKYLIRAVKENSLQCVNLLLQKAAKMKVKLTTGWINVQQHYLWPDITLTAILERNIPRRYVCKLLRDTNRAETEEELVRKYLRLGIDLRVHERPE